MRRRVSPVETGIFADDLGRALLWQTTGMSSPLLLVARLHIDLQRIQGATCRAR
jgi:hypothetical protein